MERFTVLSKTADYTSSRYQDLVLQLWHRDTTLEGVAALRAVIGRVASDSPQGLRLLVVVEPHASMPSSEARAGIAAIMRERSGSIRATSLAFEGIGFRAASVRAVVAGLNVLAHHPFPYKVFATVPEALAWDAMAPTGSGAPPQVLAELIQSLRASAMPSGL